MINRKCHHTQGSIDFGLPNPFLKAVKAGALSITIDRVACVTLRRVRIGVGRGVLRLKNIFKTVGLCARLINVVDRVMPTAQSGEWSRRFQSMVIGDDKFRDLRKWSHETCGVELRM